MFTHSSCTRCFSFRVTGLALLLGGLAAAARADTIHVCGDGTGDYLTIQEGIDAAVAGDEVVVCDGVYTGPANRNLDFAGKAITVRSANGPDACIIDCENDGRGFYFHSGETDASVVEGFTITNGNGDIDWPYGGGAIALEQGSSPTITNCRLIGNTAPTGGAIGCVESSPTIIDCTISDNAALSNNRYASGGGIYCWDGDASIENCTITGNAGLRGAGIYCWRGALRLEASTVAANTAEGDHAFGAGVACEGTQATIGDCTISENVIIADWGEGAGVYLYNVGESTIARSLILENRAEGDWGMGGGIWCAYARPRVANCIVAGNVASSIGGIVSENGARPLLVSCLIADNSGGALSSQGRSETTLVNCTLTGNDTVGVYCDYLSRASLDNCILWNEAAADEIYAYSSNEPTVRYCDIRGGWAGLGNIDADPLFVDPDGADYHLSAGSPCIDAGCNGSVPVDFADLDDDGDTSEVTPLDLDAEGRFFDDPDTDDSGGGLPPIVDMGAYEFGGSGPQPCPGDLDGDRDVDDADLGLLLAAWQTSADGDLDCDGETGQADLGILLAHWGRLCP